MSRQQQNREAYDCQLFGNGIDPEALGLVHSSPEGLKQEHDPALAEMCAETCTRRYSLKGRKGKLNFFDTAMMPIVQNALKAQRPQETIAELQNAIAETLKHAPKRKGGSRYKKPAEVVAPRIPLKPTKQSMESNSDSESD